MFRTNDEIAYDISRINLRIGEFAARGEFRMAAVYERARDRLSNTLAERKKEEAA